MIAFPGMLIPAAQRAGMKVPPDSENYDANEFPHFMVYCRMQLGAPMPTPDAHWDNAKIVAEVPEDQIRLITPALLVEAGFATGYPIP